MAISAQEQSDRRYPDAHVLLNSNRKALLTETATASAEPETLAYNFHKQVYRCRTGTADTPLHHFPSIADELGLGDVFVKDESDRFGLPSFKVLGASWAVYRAYAAKVGLSIFTEDGSDGPASDVPKLSLETLGLSTRRAGLMAVTCTEGNWGRAVGSVTSWYGSGATVFVRDNMSAETRRKIEGEGKDSFGSPRSVLTRVVKGSWADLERAAKEFAEQDERYVLVMDTASEGYDEVPKWVVEGYKTLTIETDKQLGEKEPTHVFIAVGGGTVAQAVTEHYRGTKTKVIAVEADTAAGLQASLAAGKHTIVPTHGTIMNGMDNGDISQTAWPVLKDGLTACVTVMDREAHQAVQQLERLGMHAGPCGASTLAALRRACAEKREELGLTPDSVVVLFCTEGAREYPIPEAA
jgi:diaminopropionate ammonia-lyase